ncbi:lysophospholipid acyltransferase family protein [Paraliobacillus zengyii]|uniref:lysophospholipid acyltransferase family protein n=1 Tax=Paraliobacillus zengyii TaxID=2213194 RepID=UPI000DD381E6|nr:lysophospholipid acyltransferase family protein [Paraliobacillus zengyii]
MITAKKSKCFSQLFYFYLNNYLLKRHFQSIVVEGEVDPLHKGPVIYIANHSSWWDGLLLFYMTHQQSKRHHYIMMDEVGLNKYPFFRKIGAFSINRDQPKEVVKSLRYSEQLIKQGNSLWLFPQGEIQNQEIRPLQFKTGIGYLLERFEQVTIKPVTFYYAFGEAQKPIVSIRIGDPFLVEGTSKSRKRWTSYTQRLIEKQADAQRKEVITNLHFDHLPRQYQLMKQSKSTSDRFDNWKEGVRKWTPFS